jgi:hypothetical protein
MMVPLASVVMFGLGHCAGHAAISAATLVGKPV